MKRNNKNRKKKEEREREREREKYVRVEQHVKCLIPDVGRGKKSIF